MLKERQNIILKNIVELFVKFGKPVGSATLVELDSLDCSSATVRQEMSVLEQLGYLEQPHTSGGRTPTTVGMQYYVDNLMENQEITLNEKLNTLFSRRNKNIDNILEEASKIISEITNLATVVIKPEETNEVLEQIQINKVSSNSAVVIIITNKGNVQNKVFKVEDDNALTELENLILVLNKRLKGTAVNNIEEKLKAIKPIIKDQIKNLENIFQSFVLEMIALTKASSFKSGAFNIVKYEDLDQEKMAKLIDMIENHSSFEQFVKEQEKDILIGDEGTSVIKHEYKIKGSKGHIALIGPTRMEYDKINALLDKIVDKIEKLYE